LKQNIKQIRQPFFIYIDSVIAPVVGVICVILLNVKTSSLLKFKHIINKNKIKQEFLTSIDVVDVIRVILLSVKSLYLTSNLKHCEHK
jgi:hypothetical protein